MPFSISHSVGFPVKCDSDSMLASILRKFIMCCGVTAFFWLGCQGLASSESQAANPPNSSKTKLIVFVHGYTGDQNTWSKFLKLVREDDALRDFEVHTMDYPTSVGWKNRSIRQIGDLLWTQLIERFSAYREVYLIGHSMGGLVICSMVIEQLKAGRAQDLKPIRQILLFGTPNNGKQIPKLFSFFDKQLADISSAEQTVEELRNELINRVYNPRISAGDENYKLHIPITVVIGLEDDIVDEGSARSFFRDPSPLTVPGDHNSMKEPDSRDSLAYVIVRNKLLSSRKPDQSFPPSNTIDPVIDLAVGEPFGSKTVIRLINSGVQSVVNVAVNLRCFFLKEKNDPSPTLFFAGFPSAGNAHSWWVVDRIEPGGDYTKDAKESLATFLSNSDKLGLDGQVKQFTEVVLAVDIVYQRQFDQKRYQWSGMAQLMKDSKTGEPFLWPLSTSDYYQQLLKSVTAPNYRMGPNETQLGGQSSAGSATGDPPFPQLGMYFNGLPLEGQRIPIKMEKSGGPTPSSPSTYHISIRNIEVREEGRKMGVHVSTPRWRLSEKDIECLSGCGDGEPEPSDAAQYPTVFRGPAFFVDAGGKSYFQHILFRKHGHPATEIRTELELRYGPPDPVHATFTILPYE